LAVGVLASALGGVAGAQDLERLYRETCERLVCQCGCNEQLTVCAMQNCHSATPMRAEIREKLQAGMGIEKIVEAFVAQYGKKVLSAPTMKGFDLTAWIMPFLIFALGLVAVAWIVRRMTRPAALAEAPEAALDPRVEAELREFEEES
jgi:cytochrome c-type biogenesis protein CcmH/NrfF